MESEIKYIKFPKGSTLLECQEIARENKVFCKVICFNGNVNSDNCDFRGNNNESFTDYAFSITKDMKLEKANLLAGTDNCYILIFRKKQVPKSELHLADVKEGMLVSELENIHLKPRERIYFKCFVGNSIVTWKLTSEFAYSNWKNLGYSVLSTKITQVMRLGNEVICKVEDIE